MTTTPPPSTDTTTPDRSRHGLVFGAGAVGRGFIGEIFLDAGWAVTFVETSPELVEALAAGWYPHDTVSSSGTTRKILTGCSALHSSDVDAVSEAVATADVVVTCVGARNLPHIAPTLARGLARRRTVGTGPLDILLAENLHDGPVVLMGLLAQHLDPTEGDAVLGTVGIVETSIGRMIPVPTPAQRAEHPALVAVEPYRQLPFDVRACRAGVPAVPDLVSDEGVPFTHYVDRKLHVHNQGHCLTAYLGALAGHTEIAPAISDPRIAPVVRAAMETAAGALASRDGVDPAVLAEHVDDLLDRFANPGLGDTVERVGRDPERKLAPGERFLGALGVAARWGDAGPLLVGVALAAHRLAVTRPEEDPADVAAPVRAEVTRLVPHLAERFDDLFGALIAQAGIEEFLAAQN